MLVVYVAGPFRAPTAWGIAENVRAAERVGLAVARAGAMPLIPHANTGNFHGEGDDQLWLDGTMELLRRCDAVVLVPGWQRSSGTKAEVAEAERLGLPVFDLGQYRDENLDHYEDAPNECFNDGLREFFATKLAQWSRHVGERTRAVAGLARSASGIRLDITNLQGEETTATFKIRA